MPGPLRDPSPAARRRLADLPGARDARSTDAPAGDGVDGTHGVEGGARPDGADGRDETDGTDRFDAPDETDGRDGTEATDGTEQPDRTAGGGDASLPGPPPRPGDTRADPAGD